MLFEVNDLGQTVLKLDATMTFGVSIIVLLIGLFIVSKWSVLRKYCIPPAIVGGTLFSLLVMALYTTDTLLISLDTTTKTVFMVGFFCTVGFCADLEVLKKGGKAVFIFLIIASVLAVCQNILGVTIATVLGANPLIGIATGSVPMIGGHGTSGAFGPLLEEAGLVGGTSIAVSAATFGLIAGCVIGGPIARHLIEKNKLKPIGEEGLKKHANVKDDNSGISDINTNNLVVAFYQIGVAVAIGSVITFIFKKLGITLPAYIGAMLVAAVIRNIKWKHMKINMKEINILGSLFLATFLSQALMDLKLWELAGNGLTITVILFAQALLTGIFAMFICFNLMGRDYDAAVISAGLCGFGLGATPNAVANMNSVCTQYYPSAKSFFIVPIVGGMFIDFTNTIIITTFINFIT